MKKIAVFLLMLVILFFGACDNQEENDVEKTPIEEPFSSVEFVEIKVDDESKLEEEFIYQNTKYYPNEIEIIAVTSEGESIIITSVANYSCDTTTIGNTTVKVTFVDFQIEYNVIVVENPVSKIELSFAGVKLYYNQNEEFSADGLKVYAYYLSGLVEEINDYSVSLKYNSNIVEELEYAGSYLVVVSTIIEGSIFEKTFTIVVQGENKITYSELVINLDEFKTNYVDNETIDFSNLVIYGKIDEEELLELKSDEINIDLLYNGNIVDSFVEDGTYEVVITYIGSNNCLVDELSFEVEYSNTSNDINGLTEYSEIILEHDNVKKSFFNLEEYSSEGLIVKGIKDNQEEVLDSKDYKISFKNKSSDKYPNYFIEAGTYVVEVTYIGSKECDIKTATYEVEYSFDESRTITFGYSGQGYTDIWEVTVYKYVDFRGLITKPNENTVFLGFSDIDEDFIKVYIETRVSEGRYTATYVTDYYEYINYCVRASSKQPEVPQYYSSYKDMGVFVRYNLDNELSDERYQLHVAEVDRTKEETLNVSIVSSTTVNISIPNSYDMDICELEFGLYSNDDFLRYIDLTLVIDNLDSSKSYYVLGSYVGYNNYRKYTITVSTTTFSTEVFATLEQINTEAAILNVSGQSIDISLEEFINHTPDGYNLSGFLVTDETGKIVLEKEFSDNLDSLYITGLSEGEKYLIQSYYDKASTLKAKAKNPTPGYRIYFVGFWVFATGPNSCRIRMTYENEVLYTYYVSKGSTYDSDLYDFMLPIKYENYCVAGAYASLSNIDSDVDIEVILIPKNETDQFNVVFYKDIYVIGYSNHFENNILDIQQVSKGASATAPAIEQEIICDTAINPYNLYFVRWSGNYSKVTSTQYLYPQYKKIYYYAPYVDDITYSVVDNKIRIDSFEVENSESKKYYTIKLVDPNGNSTIISENYNDITKFKEAPVTAGINYKLVVEFKYETTTSNGEKTITESRDILIKGVNIASNYQAMLVFFGDNMDMILDVTDLSGNYFADIEYICVHSLWDEYHYSDDIYSNYFSINLFCDPGEDIKVYVGIVDYSSGNPLRYMIEIYSTEMPTPTPLEFRDLSFSIIDGVVDFSIKLVNQNEPVTYEFYLYYSYKILENNQKFNEYVYSDKIKVEYDEYGFIKYSYKYEIPEIVNYGYEYTLTGFQFISNRFNGTLDILPISGNIYSQEIVYM